MKIFQKYFLGFMRDVEFVFLMIHLYRNRVFCGSVKICGRKACETDAVLIHLS